MKQIQVIRHHHQKRKLRLAMCRQEPPVAQSIHWQQQVDPHQVLPNKENQAAPQNHPHHHPIPK